MEGIEFSFVVPRSAAQLPEGLRADTERSEPNTQFINKPEDIIHSLPMRPYNRLLEDYQVRMINLLSSRIVQFVRQVGGYLQLELNQLLLDIFKDFTQFLSSSTMKAPTAMLAKIGPVTMEALQHITEAESEAYASRRFYGYERLMTLPTMVSEIYFNSELAAHTREAIQRIKNLKPLRAQLQNVSQATLYHYLVHSENWMPDFARMVAELIMHDRRKKYATTTRFQFERADQGLFLITQKFGDEFCMDEPLLATPAPRAPQYRSTWLSYGEDEPSTLKKVKTELERQFAGVDT